MENFDIIIYAAIAAFLFFRLWSVLGQTDEDPPKSRKEKPFSPQEMREQDEENVMVLEGRAKRMYSEALTEAGNARTSLAGILDQIKTLDAEFDEKEFLDGAKGAFSAIVTAFAAGDLSSVSRFLGPAVSGPFNSAIEARRKAGQTMKNSIEKIVAADIVEAKIEDDSSILTVEFVTYQINQLIEKDGSTKDLDKSEEIRDRWFFCRDLKEEDPNWLLFETQS